MGIDKIFITIKCNDREEDLEIVDLDHTNPDVLTLVRNASESRSSLILVVHSGLDEVDAALWRLRWGNQVGKFEKPPVETNPDEAEQLEKLNRRLADTELTSYTLGLNALHRAGYIYVWQVVEKNQNDLLKNKGFGKKGLKVVKEFLSEYGLYLGMKLRDEIRAQLIQPE